MLDRWNVFLQTFIDFAWVTEMLIVSLAWVIVCHGLNSYFLLSTCSIKCV